MVLENMILERLSACSLLQEKLAAYGGRPAVFFESVPSEEAAGWGEKGQYPYLLVSLDRQPDPERKNNGTLRVNLFCDTNGIWPEEIEPLVKHCLQDLFFPADESLYSLSWYKTGTKKRIKNGTGTVAGILGHFIHFDLVEYFPQTTTSPDPITAINRYIKEAFPEAMVIGLDRADEVFAVSTAEPVIYCRIEQIAKDTETSTVAWMNGKIAIHIICSLSEARNKYAAALANRFSLDGEVEMLDFSPMTLTELTLDNRADYLKDGQLTITAHYGLLKYTAKPHAITEVKGYVC